MMCRLPPRHSDTLAALIPRLFQARMCLKNRISTEPVTSILNEPSQNILLFEDF
ncbi:hypothetical protein BN903_43 [Halorubrum sp. AJ67]|nr:hypothetical protein BN903_43 [Halorubrum sp. AJ67]